ncbi:MAG: hypothetical protein LBI87_02300 [Candidatus Accumulibacter sp.]|jgi:hypothetical protein|nr:hypothetical protein [Accumulibacter sp.]
MNSGDQEAIKMLMLARANPANYSQYLAGGMNKGNDTLKTALGVMARVAAGNLVANAITASAVSGALEDSVQANLGGLDDSGHDLLASSDIGVDGGNISGVSDIVVEGNDVSDISDIASDSGSAFDDGGSIFDI